MPEFHLFLPQMRMTLDAIVERAQAAESGGLHRHVGHGSPRPAARARAPDVRGDDHQHVARRAHESAEGRQPRPLRRVPPSRRCWRAKRWRSTTRPVVASSWGSDRAPSKTSSPRSASGPESARDRTTRLGETLEVLRLLWSGESFSFEGQYFTINEGRQLPTPLEHIPIVVGGAGPRTMDLVAEYADWWNCPIHRLDKLDEMRSRAGSARVSTQQMVTFIANESERERCSKRPIAGSA